MASSKEKLNFEDEWRKYLNRADEWEDLLLRRCLRAAQTFDEICQVFVATSSQSDDTPERGASGDLGDVRSLALKRLIASATNVQEARRALAHASKKTRGRFYYPARFKEATAKVANFS